MTNNFCQLYGSVTDEVSSRQAVNMENKNNKYNRQFALTKQKNLDKVRALTDAQLGKVRSQERWVKNISGTNIPDRVLKFLSLGPKFSIDIPMKEISIPKLLSDVENVINLNDSLSPDAKNIKRAMATNIITNNIKPNKVVRNVIQREFYNCAFDVWSEASDTALGEESAATGRQTKALANVSGASGTTLRKGTTRPCRSGNDQGSSLDLPDSHVTGDPAPAQRRERQRWTREMNKCLITAYFQVTEGEKHTKKYAEKVAERWMESYPDKQFTGKHLIAQVKNIKMRKLLAPEEIELMRAESVLNSPVRRIYNIRRSIELRRTLTRTEIDYVQQSNEEQPIQDHQHTTLLESDEATEGILLLFQEYRLKWEGITMKARPKITKLQQITNTKVTMRAINAALEETITTSESFEHLCHLVYCAAMVANTIHQTKSKNNDSTNRTPQRPPWEDRINTKINTLRKEIGILHSYLNNINPSNRVQKKVHSYAKKMKLKQKDPQFHLKLKTRAEILKQKIAALGNRLKRYNKRTQRYRQNNLFTGNQKEFYRSLEEDQGNLDTTPPKPEDMRKFWSNIWSKGKDHNTEATWIKTEMEELRELEEMAPMQVTEEDVRATIGRMKNWTSPGIDVIQNFWWKTLTSTHKVLAQLISKALIHPDTIPEYFTHGITHLVPKKGDLRQPGNYRPITCLPSAYKIITSTVAFKINEHIKANNIMAWEQNGCRRKGRGSKELLMIDNMITKQAKKRLKNISMAWIDYQKAFDSVPHTWLLEVLKIYRVNRRVIALLEHLMRTWRTTLKVHNKSATYETSEVEIKRGIFQGDSLSPLWFCLALNILSKILNRSTYGYSINQQIRISHLFYMDDLKLYARGWAQLEGLLELVRKYSEDIAMTFGLEKCATVNVKRGKMSRGENIILSDGREMTGLRYEDRYKYLGVQQTFEIMHRENKDNTKNELLKRVKKVLRTQLSAKNKIMAINSWAIPTFTYTAGILSWSKSELEQLDRSIRTSLTQHGVLHPNSAVERLYLPRKEGGRGMTKIGRAALKEAEKINDYFRKSNLPVHQWVASCGRVSVSETSNEEVPENENNFETLRQA
ncbi:uncharacterized protein LOC123678658 [Harmonia axyridis]|uniref:uncharacterized protein LOC123678658 n=1 Tax=Harmonia axyridis TaxID=115357 RepID=UPI001E2783CB|nr:uncharacterized protein LOC123678658 [Harmonia axyridis]